MAAVHADGSVPGSVPPAAAAVLDATAVDINTPGLREVCARLHMDPDPVNELQKPDIEFLLEMAQLPVDLAGMPDGTDVEAMRRWVQDIFQSEGWAREKERFQSRRRRQANSISKTIEAVPCPDASGEHFDLWIYEPQSTATASEPRPVLLMFHGGGWIHGSPIADEVFAEPFSSELNAVVVGVDYRLAPEYPFPAGLNDCAQALRWVCQNAKTYNIDTKRIGLWGASAGANLAAAVALKSTDADFSTEQFAIRLASLVVPATAHPKAEATFDQLRSFEKSQTEDLFSNVPPFPDIVAMEVAKLYNLYVGDKGDPCDPLASPLASHPAPEHPPALVTIAACDFLRPQGLKYAQLLRTSGVRVTEDVLRGVPHGFTFALNSSVVNSWFERQIDAFAAAFGKAA